MYALLALVVALCPAVQTSLDEHVLAALKDKFGEKLQVCAVRGAVCMHAHHTMSQHRWCGG
jgi:hypothetical protein